MVIAIISVLISIVSISFTEARKGTRDGVRMTALSELQLAIEKYKAQKGQYPDQGCGVAGTNWAGPGSHSSDGGVTCNEYITGLAPEYIAKLPTDPNSEAVADMGFLYQVSTNRDAYKIMVYGSVEKKTITSYGDKFARCPAKDTSGECGGDLPPEKVYAVYSPGAENW